MRNKRFLSEYYRRRNFEKLLRYGKRLFKQDERKAAETARVLHVGNSRAQSELHSDPSGRADPRPLHFYSTHQYRVLCSQKNSALKSQFFF